MKAFVRERVLRILRGESDLVVRGICEMATKRGIKGEKLKTITKACNYLKKNSRRMRYDEYLAKGYPIASGVIEGACRHLVKDHMKRSGMHWTRLGAQAMLDVRSVLIVGQWQAYLEYRVERETQRMYPHRTLVSGPDFAIAA